MERPTSWRPIEPGEEPNDQTADPPDDGSRADPLRLILASLAGVAILLAAAAVLWAGTPQPQVVVGPGTETPDLLAEPADSGAGGSLPSPASELLVDVQGAVSQPGLQRVPAGSRVGDAISAAGGYSPQLDIRAAAERLNLAELLADGAKIYVPARGDPTVPPASAHPGGGAGQAPGAQPAGLIDVNSAGQAQLETLPGIGPVTAGKIITAREESPFVTVDDLLSRKVVGPATFEKIKSLISVGP